MQYRYGDCTPLNRPSNKKGLDDLGWRAWNSMRKEQMSQEEAKIKYLELMNELKL